MHYTYNNAETPRPCSNDALRRKIAIEPPRKVSLTRNSTVAGFFSQSLENKPYSCVSAVRR